MWPTEEVDGDPDGAGVAGVLPRTVDAAGAAGEADVADSDIVSDGEIGGSSSSPCDVLSDI